jgi:Cu2+-exporting ATPase
MVIDSQQQARPAASSAVGVTWGRETLQLRDEDVFGKGNAELCSRFLRRVFSVDEVRSVQIDRPRSTAVIRYERGAQSLAELLQRLAAAIRGGTRTGAESPVVQLLWRDLSRPKWTIYRHRGVLTTWQVVRDQPGLLNLRHEVLASDPALARRIVHQVEAIHGVQGSAIRPLSGTLSIRFDPAQTRAERLLRVLESAPQALSREAPDGSDPPPVRFGLVNTAVALSVASDFLLPALWPATAGLLIGSSLGTFRQAAAQVGKGEIGLPVLYTSIAAATLTTGQFLPWAAMNWLFRLWKHCYQHQLATARRRLLGEVIQQQRFARLEAAGGIEVEVPVERLVAGDRIVVSAGEKIAVDGRVVKGYGLVDERIVRGAAGLSRKGPEEDVHAGSILLAGDLQVETRRHGAKTRAATLARAALAATTHEPGGKTPTLRGERFASRVVVPTLATAGLGLYLGGAPAALTIMDTDYASGPGLAYSLETLQALAPCFQQGIVVRDPEALERLARADVLLVDDHAELEAAEPEVASVRVFPGHTEYQVLRFAATALRDLDDERARALRAACQARRIALLDRVPTQYGTDVTMTHRGQVIKVGNLGGRGPGAEAGTRRHDDPSDRPLDSLMVGINGQIAGLIDFRRSSRLGSATALKEFRDRARQPLAIGLISERPESQVQALAAAMGADFHQGGLTPEDLARLIRGCRNRGLKVAYVGECLRKARAAREADVAISLDAEGLEHLDRNPAPILLLRPDLARLGVLLEVTRLHNRRIRVAQGSALIPNLFCVAGAFFLGFTSLTTVMITNLGTYSTYARTTAAIRELERRLARSSPRRTFRAEGEQPKTPR